MKQKEGGRNRETLGFESNGGFKKVVIGWRLLVQVRQALTCQSFLRKLPKPLEQKLKRNQNQ